MLFISVPTSKICFSPFILYLSNSILLVTWVKNLGAILVHSHLYSIFNPKFYLSYLIAPVNFTLKMDLEPDHFSLPSPLPPASLLSH